MLDSLLPRPGAGSAPAQQQVNIDGLSAVVVEIGRSDLSVALALAERQADAGIRSEFFAALAMAVVRISPDKAIELAQRVEPRLKRENLLLKLSKAALAEGADGAALISSRLVEPALSDLADADAAVALAASDPAAGVAAVEKVESSLVKSWAYLSIGLVVAQQDPQAALQLDRLLPTVYDRDELYSIVVPYLAEQDADRALPLALRIADRMLRSRAVTDVCAKMFRQKPGLALLVLEKNLPGAELEERLRQLLADACERSPEEFEAKVEEVRGQVPEAAVREALARCCQKQPALVARVAPGYGLGQDDAVRHCLVCGGAASQPLEAARSIEDQFLRSAAIGCLVQKAALQDIPNAMELLKLLGEGPARDAALLDLVSALLAANKMELAGRLVGTIHDPYVASRARLALLKTEKGEELARGLVLVEANLPKIRDDWRRDEILAELSRFESSSNLSRAVEHAGGIRDARLQAQVLGDMAALYASVHGFEKSVAQEEVFLDLSARGFWCLNLAQLRVKGIAAAKAP